MGLSIETARSFTGVIEVAKTREGALAKLPTANSPPKIGGGAERRGHFFQARSAGGIS